MIVQRDDVTVWYKNGTVHIKGDKGDATMELDSGQLMNLYNGYSVKAVLQTEIKGDEDA